MKRKLFIVMLLAIAAASCRHSDMESVPITVVNPYVKPREVEFLRFKAQLPVVSTKAIMDAESGKTVWEKGDRVLICGDQKEAIYEAISGGKDTTTLVRVSGDTLSTGAGKIFTAYYPAVKGVVVPDKAEYDGSSIRNLPMTATGSKNLNFESSCGVLSCHYKPASNMLVKSVVFSSDQPLSENGVIELSCTGKSPQGMNIYADSGATFSIVLAEGTYSSLKVMFNTAESQEEITLGYDVEIKKGVISEVDLNQPDGDVVNLSRTSTANSYVISAAGNYIFKPTRGCSDDLIDGIASVEVLWEMNNEDTAPSESMFSELSYSSGKIHFSTIEPYRPGNALIAARNASGTILWSWHIWAVGNDITTFKYDTDGNIRLMDRSLGALEGVRSSNPGGANKYASSLLYQWGRKDPFPGQTIGGDRNLIVVKGMGMTKASGPVSLETASQNPTVFYLGEKEWCSESAASQWTSTEKTIYDPCPPGYMVSPASAFGPESEVFYNGFTVSSVSRGGSFIFSLSGNYYCYPLSAYFDGTTGDKGSKATYWMWSSNFNADSSVCCYMWYANKATQIDPAYATPRSWGLSVRCMKKQAQ